MFLFSLVLSLKGLYWLTFGGKPSQEACSSSNTTHVYVEPQELIYPLLLDISVPSNTVLTLGDTTITVTDAPRQLSTQVLTTTIVTVTSTVQPTDVIPTTTETCVAQETVTQTLAQTQTALSFRA